ncbi:MAG TPA: non-heme iron oxygenase ferredoxin subunit [Acetobacteraceae bacterium]|nr:non-heme iron oxygenase ferredoxin subunit [Acetobacteraceae bacterium]
MTAHTYVRAISLSDLPHGTKKAVDIAGKSVLLCNWAERIYAVSNICSHAQEKLECGRLSNGWIACPIHGARFDLATGGAKNPPATRPIPVFEVRIVDEWIEVDVGQAAL